MACEKCIAAGQEKIIHYQKAGRWESRIFCKHTYAGAKLNKRETGHVVSRHQVVNKIKRKPTPNAQKIKYTDEMDQFILQRYTTSRTHDIAYGSGQMKRLAKEFAEHFGITYVTPNQIIGRWTRLQRRGVTLIEQVRHEPSLPVLKFMRG